MQQMPGETQEGEKAVPHLSWTGSTTNAILHQLDLNHALCIDNFQYMTNLDVKVSNQ